MLVFALAAYAFSGRGFAYVGLPPLYAGEFVLVLGLVAFLLSGCWLAVLTTIPSVILLSLLTWVTIQTLPYIKIHGFNALRDSVVITYGLFSFILIALVVEQPVRLLAITRSLARLLFIFCPIAVIAYYITRINGRSVVSWPIEGNFRVLEVRPGEIAVHLAGAASLAIVGFLRVSKIWIVILVLGIALIATQSRGGTLAFLSAVILAAVLMNKVRVILRILMAGALAMTLAFALDLKVDFGSNEGDRSLSARQIVENLTSILVSSDEGNLDDNKLWRLRWWSDIRDYTFHGPYFWSGKGFGVNLSEADGYYADSSDGAPPLRSPHNAHMTVLARAGIPGLTLWFLLGSSWFLMMMRNIYLARVCRDNAWAGFFVFVTSYVTAIVINASFDVALEGPMLGIWFWTLIGIGIGGSIIYRAYGQSPFGIWAIYPGQRELSQ
ncbi:O-antigen ligase family protein [Microvirga solisilvae]|uniref:O-antigen ligase family protein n=1 Tax=Microvirga solisilvae TaxID=2919498 RepID=UPI001FAF52B8|nr:O-antigen ligase family protein [Microvirga solisilvae]